MLLVAVAVALPYPQDAAVPAVAAPVDGVAPVPGADGEKVDERFFLRPHGHHHHHGHHGGYGGYNQGYGGYNQGYGNNYNSKHNNFLYLYFYQVSPSVGKSSINV